MIAACSKSGSELVAVPAMLSSLPLTFEPHSTYTAKYGNDFRQKLLLLNDDADAKSLGQTAIEVENENPPQ